MLNLQHGLTPRALCRVCGSQLDRRIATRGRHWNCEVPEWMVRWDERVGDRHLISTPARWRKCGCGSLVIVAIAEGIAVAVDPAVVDSVAELNGLMCGRRSFDLITVGSRTEIMYRDVCRQETRNDPVVLEHSDCGHRVPVDDPLDAVKERIRSETRKKKTGGRAE